MSTSKNIRYLKSEYARRRREIKERLKEFKDIHKGKDRDIFQELCFCILTANANALRCDEAIKELKDAKLLFKGEPHKLKPALKGKVRFHNKKADFIVRARDLFKDPSGMNIKGRIDFNNAFEAREWLVDNIKGYGYKEASHFLRNIGLGSNIAILDRHILRNLKEYGVISKIPSSMGSRNTYLAIEKKMREFSRKIHIPLPDLDLLFWSIKTGFIFK